MAGVFNQSNDTTMSSLTLDDLQLLHDGSQSSQGIVSDDLLPWFELINYVILSGGIGICGTFANVINIIVFVKQGFSDSINISLLGLAISDLGALLTLVWMAVCFTPQFLHSYQFGLDAKKIQYLTAGWPHVCFARITSFITAFITFERCLCIALPLRVKRIITPRRTFIVVSSIFFLIIASVAPVYFAARFQMVHEASVNKSVFSFLYVESGPMIENVSFSINVFAQIGAFVLVIGCTAVLLQSLIRKSNWRKSVASTDDSLSSRDKKVMKMVTSVAVIFIVCFLPSAVNLILMICLSEYSLVGRESNMFLVGWGFLNNLEAINSSANIIIYYNMSSKYKAQFHQLWPCSQRGKQANHEVGVKSTANAPKPNNVDLENNKY